MRLIDANLNRALEGARVCEEIARFHLCAIALFRRLRRLRHSRRLRWDYFVTQRGWVLEELPLAVGQDLLEEQRVFQPEGLLARTRRMQEAECLQPKPAL